MNLRWSLSRKVLVLVIVPVLVQSLCLIWLLKLGSDSEQALERSVHAHQIANALVLLRGDIYRILTIAAGEKTAYHGNEDVMRGYVNAMHQRYTELADLTRNDDPALHRSIEESRTEALAGFNKLLEIKKSMEENPADIDGRRETWREVRKHMYNVLRRDFSKDSQDQFTVSQRNLAMQAEFRKMQMVPVVALILATLLPAAISAIYLTREITMKIAKVSDNAYRLASNRPLNQVMQGDDEIARLDQTFHQMAGSLREALRKERAVVENARDFICSLDGNLKFTATNPACQRLLGESEKDLIGLSLLGYVPEQSENEVRDFFGSLKGQGTKEGDAIEVQLLPKGREPIYAVLSAHWSEDERSYFVVVHDITDRRQAEELKQEVMVMVTHDLRTPLATLQNILKYLRSGNYGRLDQKGSEYIMVANRNVERMSNLVNDILDVEKVKSGLMTLDRQAFELVDCFTAARELAGAFAEEAGVKIAIQQTDVFVDADQDRVTRVIANLIGNGVKFSPAGGTVTVSARQEGKWIYTAVDDQGPGVPQDQLEKIFERFRQAHSAETKGKGGSGLGLTICQAIVELHGGKIWVENLKPHGSRFIFTLPSPD